MVMHINPGMVISSIGIGIKAKKKKKDKSPKKNTTNVKRDTKPVAARGQTGPIGGKHVERRN